MNNISKTIKLYTAVFLVFFGMIRIASAISKTPLKILISLGKGRWGGMRG